MSLRTPLGTIGSRGVSIRTGIPGLTFRLNDLSRKVGLSDRKKAILLISEEMDQASRLGTEYSDKHSLFKSRWNKVSIEYPSREYDIARDDLQYVFELGRENQEYLRGLIALASEHRTGLTQALRQPLKELDKLQDEVERLLNRFISLKEEGDRALSNPRTVPPPIPNQAAAIPIQPQLEDRGSTVHFACSSCQQHLEVNASASGQEFNCPSCGARLTVPNR